MGEGKRREGLKSGHDHCYCHSNGRQSAHCFNDLRLFSLSSSKPTGPDEVQWRILLQSPIPLIRRRSRLKSHQFYLSACYVYERFISIVSCGNGWPCSRWPCGHSGHPGSLQPSPFPTFGHSPTAGPCVGKPRYCLSFVTARYSYYIHLFAFL